MALKFTEFYSFAVLSSENWINTGNAGGRFLRVLESKRVSSGNWRKYKSGLKEQRLA